MRSIETADIKNRRQRRSQLWVGVILVGLMIISTAGFASYLREDTASMATSTQEDGSYYNGQYWIVPLQGQTFYLVSDPSTLENVSVSIDPNSYAGQSLFIDAPQQIQNHLALNIGRYTERIQPACLGACEEDLPEKDCTTPIIIYKDSLENKVYQQDKCAFIEGDIRAVDAFIARFVGITAP